MSYKTDMQKFENTGLTFSIIVETENLGMAGIEDLQETLDSLKRQTYPIERAKEVLIIAAGHVAEESLDMLRSKYPWLKVHREGGKLEYTQSKMRGAEVATGDIVMFADSDVEYDETWLENMLYGFVAAPGATVMAGETRIRGSSVYAMAIQLSWMILVLGKIDAPVMARHFQLNNFAIKRQVMLSVPFFYGLPVYRANIVEWKKQLMFRGYSIMRVPNARGYHLPPGNFWDWWYRMLINGADGIVKADFYFKPDGKVVEKFSPLRRLVRVPLFALFKIYHLLQRTYVLLREDFDNIFTLILALPLAILFIVVMLFGSLIALFDRDYLFRKITARESEHVV